MIFLINPSVLEGLEIANSMGQFFIRWTAQVVLLSFHPLRKHQTNVRGNSIRQTTGYHFQKYLKRDNLRTISWAWDMNCVNLHPFFSIMSFILQGGFWLLLLKNTDSPTLTKEDIVSSFEESGRIHVFVVLLKWSDCRVFSFTLSSFLTRSVRALT